MENKALNLAIYNQMKEAANEAFSKLENIKPGKYTAAEIEKQYNVTNKFGICYEIGRYIQEERDYEYFLKLPESYKTYLDWYEAEKNKLGYWGETLTFSAGEFTCQVARCSIFMKMAQWESMARISGINKAVFVKEEDSEVIASFTLSSAKESKILSEYASKDQIRPQICQIYIDIENNSAVGTDTHILGVYPVQISDIRGEVNRLWIDPKTWKKIAGLTVTVEICKKGTLAKITTSKGDIYNCEQINCNYPDYLRVLPAVNRDGLFKIEKSDLKGIRDFAKSLVKSTGLIVIRIQIEAYSKTGKLIFKDEDYGTSKVYNFTLSRSPKINVATTVSPINLYRIAEDWNGNIWYLDTCKTLTLDSKESKVIICMPCYIKGLTYDLIPDSIEGKIKSLERNNYKVAEAKKTVKESKPVQSVFYPVATLENQNLIDLNSMIETANQEIIRESIWNDFEESLNNEIIAGIIDIMAIIEDLSEIFRKIDIKPENQIKAPEIQIMAYYPESFSGPAYVEFSEDCQNWVNTSYKVEFNTRMKNENNEFVYSDWHNADNSEYTAPVNMALINSMLDLFSELSKLVAVAEICFKAIQIEEIAKDAGLITYDAENTEKEINPDPIKSEESINNGLPELIPELPESKRENNIEPLPDPVSVRESKQGKIKGLFRKAREYAAVFF